MLKKIVLYFLSAVLLLGSVMLASCKKKKVVTVYATCEDYRIENAQKMFDEKFPELEVRVEYKSTGDLSSKLIAEGEKTDCDIIMELENAYMEKIADNLATLDGVDFSVYQESLVPASRKYVPLIVSSGAIIISPSVLNAKGLPTPNGYDDLLKEEYKGLISMPSPKSSSTGYMFLLNLVNAWGEEKAFEYFDRLSENISGAGFTSSGSGPVQALKLGEAAIALGMTSQAVVEINDNGADFTVQYFEEGAPYDVYSSAIMKGHESDADVMRVFEYLVSDVTPADKELYAPETIYKDRTFTKPNYPQTIPYGDMTGLEDITRKEGLLNKWKY